MQLFYAPFCGFTAQTIFDPLYITLYNVVFTSIPVMIIGVLDQELSIDETPPEVYEVRALAPRGILQEGGSPGFTSWKMS